MEDINGFSKLIMIDGRSFDNLKQRMIEQVQVPAQILQIGLKPNGFPFAILKVSIPESPSAAPTTGKKKEVLLDA
jgi:hypothetical protein